MNKKDFLEFLQPIVEVLDKNNVSYEIPFCYINKSEFNHINIVISELITIKELSFYFSDLDFVKEENGIFFTKIWHFPVNFIRVPYENIKYAFYYYNWNITNVLLQCLAKYFNLKYIVNGLYGEHDILISRNLQEIIEFFGLNFKMYNVGFVNEFLIYSYICNSPFFNSKLFNMELFEKFDPFFKYNKEIDYYKKFMKQMRNYKNNETDITDFVEFVDAMFPDSKYMEKYYKIEIESCTRG
jgi:hypothetical protein